jgi:hypothetical protein
MAILSSVHGLIVSLFHLYSLKFVKCTQDLVFYFPAVLKSCDAGFIISFKYV